jgi:dTDP-4-amino-4,6-dideoxygalactose transaminase
MSAESTIAMLDMGRLHAPLEEALVSAFSEVLKSGRFIGGPVVERFEQELAEHVGAAHAVGVSSGTDALLVAMMALGVGPGDEVITTPYTFFATAGSISRLGARPVFVDIDPDSFNIDTDRIAAAITERTVGIIPVHLFGQCAKMDAPLALAEARGLWIIEDAAQAIGATYDNRQAGTMGTMGTFSFFPAKNLGALGDGGAVVTGDEALAEKVRALKQHGAHAKYTHEMVGGNFRLDAVQAALLSVKLPYLASWEAGRRQVAARYLELLGALDGLSLPVEGPAMHHVYNQFVLRTEARERLREALGQAGVASAIYYPAPLHVQRCFQALGYRAGDFEESERASRESLAIPIDPLLDQASLDRVAAVIAETISNASEKKEAR